MSFLDQEWNWDDALAVCYSQIVIVPPKKTTPPKDGVASVLVDVFN